MTSQGTALILGVAKITEFTVLTKTLMIVTVDHCLNKPLFVCHSPFVD